MGLHSARLNKAIVGVLMILTVMGLSGYINLAAAQSGRSFNDNKAICQEVINLNFSAKTYNQGSTIKIVYRSLEGLPEAGSPRPSVLGDDPYIISRNFSVTMTYLNDDKSRESARDYYKKTDLIDLYRIEAREKVVENVKTAAEKSVIISRESSKYATYRFRRDIIFQDYDAVVKIQSAGLDSRCINMPANQFLDIVERHALSVLTGQGVAGSETVKETETDNIDLATEETNLAVAFLNKKKAGGASDREIADLVNRIVSQRIQVINNIVPDRWNDWSNLGAWVLNHFWGYFEDSYGKWRDIACFNYDTNAIWAWNNRIGQCEDTAQLSYYLLKNAGVSCNMYAVGGHAFVIINTSQSKIRDSRKWADNVVVVDPWQNQVLSGEEAYQNGYIFNHGKNEAVKTTQLYQPPQGYEDIKSRNIVWDKKNKTWKPREGYKFKYLSGAWMGYCVPRK